METKTKTRKPCKEFKSLKNYLNKYGKMKNGCSVYIYDNELFSVAMGGKRGVLWDEEGERIYLDYKPNKCKDALATLRKVRTSRDKMICEKNDETYIDPFEKKASEYYEIECVGEKRSYMLVSVLTPTGRLKCQIKIY